MNVFDFIFFGWYQILDKTIYSYGTNKEGIGPREHSFFITFLLYGINVWTVLRYLLAKFLNSSFPLYYSLSLAILIFAIGYLVYFKRNRANRVIRYETKNIKTILSIAVAITYSIITVYLMFKVGNYVRYQLTSL